MLVVFFLLVLFLSPKLFFFYISCVFVMLVVFIVLVVFLSPKLCLCQWFFPC